MNIAKRFILGILLLVVSLSAFTQTNGVTYNATILRVVDGDTVIFKAVWLPEPLKKELSLRIYGVDTPEKSFRAKCVKEDELGKAASVFTQTQIANAKKKQIVLMGWDKYGGRVLGDLILDGKSLRFMLIQQGYAREYFGEAKTSWCD